MLLQPPRAAVATSRHLAPSRRRRTWCNAAAISHRWSGRSRRLTPSPHALARLEAHGALQRAAADASRLARCHTRQSRRQPPWGAAAASSRRLAPPRDAAAVSRRCLAATGCRRYLTPSQLQPHAAAAAAAAPPPQLPRVDAALSWRLPPPRRSAAVPRTAALPRHAKASAQSPVWAGGSTGGVCNAGGDGRGEQSSCVPCMLLPLQHCRLRVRVRGPVRTKKVAEQHSVHRT